MRARSAPRYVLTTTATAPQASMAKSFHGEDTPSALPALRYPKDLKRGLPGPQDRRPSLQHQRARSF